MKPSIKLSWGLAVTFAACASQVPVATTPSSGRHPASSAKGGFEGTRLTDIVLSLQWVEPVHSPAELRIEVAVCSLKKVRQNFNPADCFELNHSAFENHYFIADQVAANEYEPTVPFEVTLTTLQGFAAKQGIALGDAALVISAWEGDMDKRKNYLSHAIVEPLGLKSSNRVELPNIYGKKRVKSAFFEVAARIRPVTEELLKRFSPPTEFYGTDVLRALNQKDADSPLVVRDYLLATAVYYLAPRDAAWETSNLRDPGNPSWSNVLAQAEGLRSEPAFLEKFMKLRLAQMARADDQVGNALGLEGTPDRSAEQFDKIIDEIRRGYVRTENNRARREMGQVAGVVAEHALRSMLGIK